MVVFPEVIVLARKSSILIVNGSNMLLYFDDEFTIVKKTTGPDTR